MKCLVFKVRGDYARFRKSYTTTSALTYLLIHPVAVRGLIGAMLGIDREKLYEKTKDIEVAIQVVNQVRKDMQSFNLVNLKANDKIFRFPSNVEFLRNVEYRIFIKAEDKTLYEIDNCIKQGEYIFTPYLGSSEHIAKIEYEGIYNCEKLNAGNYKVISAVSLEENRIYFGDSDIILMTDNIPTRRDIDREYIEYKKVIFATNENTINVGTENCYKVGGYNVIFI